MKRKLTLAASIIGLVASLSLLAIMVTDVVLTIVNTIKAGNLILDVFKNISNILQVIMAMLGFVSFCLSASLIKAFRDDKTKFKKKLTSIVATILFNFTWISVFVAFVILNHSLMNIIELSIVGTIGLIANVLYIIAFKRSKTNRNKKKQRSKVDKEDERRYTFKDKAQDLLLLIDLRDSKAITQEEYERLKEEILREKIIN